MKYVDLAKSALHILFIPRMHCSEKFIQSTLMLSDIMPNSILIHFEYNLFFFNII